MHMTAAGDYCLPRPTRAARSIKMGVKKHFTGCLVIGEDEGQVLEVESHTEMMTAQVMLARPDVVSLENQLPFRWVDDTGKPRMHYFDFRVTLRDGTRIALIVKNGRTAAKPKFRAEMSLLARQVTPEFADRVSIITEKHLDPIEVHNAELLHSVRLPEPEPDAAVRRVIGAMNGAARIADIVTSAGCIDNGYRAVIRLLRSHELELTAHERIEPETYVRRRLR